MINIPPKCYHRDAYRVYTKTYDSATAGFPLSKGTNDDMTPDDSKGTMAASY